jgi:hypothetical protein
MERQYIAESPPSLWREVTMMGITCYTDAYIIGDDDTLHFISLYGRVGVVKAIGAAIIEGRTVYVEETPVSRPPYYSLRSITQNLGNGVCHKALLCPEYFAGRSSRIILGRDRQRALEFLSGAVSTPLKDDWAGWLWSRVFEPVSLTGFGYLDGHDLTDVCMISLSKTTEEIDGLVLDGIATGQLN